MNVAVEFSEQSQTGEVRIKGPLTFATVLTALKAGSLLVQGSKTLRFNLSEVGKADGSGVALLVEWARLARGLGVDLKYTNIPEPIMAIIRVGGVQDMVPFVHG